MKASQFLLLGVWAALVAAVVTYGMNHYGVGAPHAASNAETVEVPPVIGLKPDQARALLETRGLLMAIEQEREDARFEAGKIRQQNPLDGSRMRRGESVRVEIARAPTTIAAPNLVGRSASKAKEMLTQAGLTPGNVQYRANEDRAEGTVLEQVPPAGQQVAKGSKVDLVVNKLD